MATAKIQTVKGFRVGDFFAATKKYYSALTVWIVGTDGKCRLLFFIGCSIISPVHTDKSCLGKVCFLR